MNPLLQRTPFSLAALAVSVLALVGQPAIAGDGVDLSSKLKAGESLRYRVHIEQETEVSLMPGQPFENDIEYVLREDVVSVGADGTAAIDVGYEALRFDLNTGMSTASYDSTHKSDAKSSDDARWTKTFAPLFTEKIHVRLEKSGKITEIKGAKELFESIKKGVEDPGMSRAMDQHFSEFSLRRNLEFNVFPDKPVTAGATWKRDIEQPHPLLGAMKIAIESKLDSVEEHRGESCAKIEFGQTTTAEKGAAPAAMMGMRFELQSGEGKGTQWFSTKLGRVLEVTYSVVVKMHSEPAEEAERQAPEMDISSTVTGTIVLLGKDEAAFEVAKAKPADAKK